MTLAPPVIMATLPWSLLFEDVECVLSLLREELESDVRREKKSIKEVRGERKLNKKHYFGFSICVHTVTICNDMDTNSKYLQHLKHLL